MSENVRPAPGTVIFEDFDGYRRRREVVTRVTETDDHIIRYSKLTVTYVKPDGSVDSEHKISQTQKRQKFLAVGGPLDGQCVVEAEAPQYVLFNRSSRWQERVGYKMGITEDVPSAVLVWLDSLGVK